MKPYINFLRFGKCIENWSFKSIGANSIADAWDVVYLANKSTGNIEITWSGNKHGWYRHYCDVIVGVMASQITSLTSVYSGAEQRKHQSSASLAFVRGIHRWPVNSLHKGQWRGKCFQLMTSSWNKLEVSRQIGDVKTNWWCRGKLVMSTPIWDRLVMSRQITWLCVWDGCTIIFCHLLHIYPGNTGTLFPLLMFSLWYLQMIGYIMACRPCSFVCRLHHLIIIIMQTYLKALNY